MMRSSKAKSQTKLEQLLNLESYNPTLSTSALCKKLGTDPVKGLTSEAAKLNLKKYGENSLKPPKGLNPIYRFLVHNFQGADVVAWIGIIHFLLNYTIEAFANRVLKPDIEKIYVAITLSLFVNFVGAYSFIIERKTIRILERIRLSIANTKCLVIRDGQKTLLDVKELTVGDLVELHCGDRIPADIRVIETVNFQVDNSNIIASADSTPIVVTAQPALRNTDGKPPNPLTSRNIIFATTFAVEGRCKGIVLKVGDSAVIGHLERENTLLKQMNSPLIHRFNKVVLFYCGIAGILTFIFTFLVMYLDYKFLDVSTVYIAIFIAIVPEKLLICLHTNHILATLRMEKQNTLIKHFEGIETLGQCSVLCCSISGFITEDSMQLSRVWYGGSVFEVTSLTEDQLRSEGFGILGRSMHLNVSHHMVPHSERDINPVRDPVELAIVQYLTSVGSVQESKRVYEIAFSSARLYQLSIHTVEYDPRFLLVAMGAPETILRKCSTILMNGVELKLDSDMKNDVKKVIQDLSDTGDQVLACCEIFLPLNKYPKGITKFEGKYPTRRYRFVGMVSFKIPIRPTAKDSVSSCKAAGIKIVLASGDSISTTEAVARSVGIISDGSIVYGANHVLDSMIKETGDPREAIMVTGEELEEMTEAEIKYLLYNYNEIVFARIRPHQKFVIVKYFQENGDIVALTGRTIDDGPALKKANVGLVPKNASDIARHSADIILVDGNFTWIEKSVQEGRLVFENFRKSICFELTTNFPKMIPFFLYMILSIPLPLGAISILVIDIGIDFLASVSLSYEKAEPHLMRAPSKKDETIITKKLVLRSYFHIGILQTCCGMLVYFAVFGANGFLPPRLIGLRDAWLNVAEDSLQDSYGQEWSYEQRKKLETNVHTAYLYAVVITQIANLISSRTNVSSLFQVKMNWILLLIICIELVFASLLASVNLGWFDQSLKISEFRWIRVLLISPFALFIIIYDEIRKCVIRRWPKGWVAQELQYL